MSAVASEDNKKTAKEDDRETGDRDCYSVFEKFLLFGLYCILTCLFWTASTVSQFLLLFGVTILLIQKQCEEWRVFVKLRTQY